MKLFVPPWYGKLIGREDDFQAEHDSFYERELIAVFMNHDFDIEYTDFVYKFHDGDISLLMDSDSEKSEKFLKMPKSYSVEDILKTKEPIMAKLIVAQNSMGKFLLETIYQKKLFIAYLLCNGFDWQQKKSTIFIDSCLENIDSMDLRMADNEESSNWRLEKFIQTDADFCWNIRSVVGIDRKIHYSQIYKSRYKKAMHRKVDWLKDVKDHRYFKAVQSRHNAFTHPDSPFYLGSQDVLSGLSDDDYECIELNGKQTIGHKKRAFLESIEIDPDNPVLPIKYTKPLIEEAYAYRFSNPHCGFDLIGKTTKNMFKLETNLASDIFPSGLGLTSSINHYAANIYLICKIAGFDLSINYLKKISKIGEKIKK